LAIAVNVPDRKGVSAVITADVLLEKIRLNADVGSTLHEEALPAERV
jgi:hypothetical protein